MLIKCNNQLTTKNMNYQTLLTFNSVNITSVYIYIYGNFFRDTVLNFVYLNTHTSQTHNDIILKWTNTTFRAVKYCHLVGIYIRNYYTQLSIWISIQYLIELFVVLVQLIEIFISLFNIYLHTYIFTFLCTPEGAELHSKPRVYTILTV